MSNIHIPRVVKNIRSGTTVYTPVIELVVNAIQAIAEAGKETGEIRVRVLRAGDRDIIERLRAVDGFAVSDNGVGFSDKNREAFDTLYTANKADDGGKGFGRFTCLKYFDDVRIDSIFADENGLHRRTFAMGKEHDIIVDETIAPIAFGTTGSVVTISSLKSVKFADKSLEVIARVLVEKLLPYLVDKRVACPKIIVEDDDGGDPVILNDYLSAANRQIEELEVEESGFDLARPEGPESFMVRVFKIYAPRSLRSKIALVAHRREVTDVTIQSYIPEFADEFYEKAADGTLDRNFVVRAYVYGDYLDDNVSLERGAFDFGREADLFLGISQTQIEARAAEVARSAVGEEISTRRERKAQRVRDYVVEDAPWHATLVQEADLSGLPMNPSKLEIELHFQKEKYARETKVRRDVANILDSADTSQLSQKVAEVVESISQSSKNDLIHYVSMRKCVLDLFGRSLEIDDSGKHRSEGDVHDIIIPRGRDSDDLDYSQHNLWILDERLTFTSFLSSDKPINGAGSDRTDLTVFNRQIAFRGDNEPSNPIIIFEFKRPQRDDFVTAGEDPVQQIVRYVNGFRDGKFKTPQGRKISVEDNTPFYGYVVCDLTPKVERWLDREKDFTRMPDGLGWFSWFSNNKLYVEVLSWDKIRKDADMRNRVFFQHLGI